MAWRLARSLDVLSDEIRELHPGTTIWTIGDQAHANEASDHNPNQNNVVCAIDVLANRGLNLGQFAEKVKTGGHPAVKYVIFNRRIWSKTRASEGWRPYRGTNPHTTHVHVSVGVGPDGRSTGPYDDTSPWGLLEDDVSGADVWNHRIVNPVNGNSAEAEWRLLDTERKAGQILTSVTQIKATLEVVAGRDPAAAVRTEFAKLTETLVAAVRAAVPEANQATAEAALRAVLGELDEGQE